MTVNQKSEIFELIKQTTHEIDNVDRMRAKIWGIPQEIFGEGVGKGEFEKLRTAEQQLSEAARKMIAAMRELVLTFAPKPKGEEGEQ